MNVLTASAATAQSIARSYEVRVVTHFGPTGRRSALHHHGALFSHVSEQIVERCSHEHPTIPAAELCATDLLKNVLLAARPQ